jgi:hypothetical protein
MKDSKQAIVEDLKESQPGTSRDQVNINPVTAIGISHLPIFCEKCQKTNPCAGSLQVTANSPNKNLVEEATKKKKQLVNKKGFQSRPQDKKVWNVHRTERKLVYRQKKNIHGE